MFKKISNASFRCLVLTLGFAFISTFSSPTALGEPVTVPIGAFSGTFTSVSFIFQGMPVSTGPITVSLDPTGTNVFSIDNAAGVGFMDVTLLVHFPLLNTIGAPQPSIRIFEQGPASITGGVLNATFTGGGTIGSGSFLGISITNINFFSSPAPNGIPEGTIPFSMVPGMNFLTFPPEFGGGIVPIEGEGSVSLVPEPATLLLLSTGIVGVATKVRRSRKHSKRKADLDKQTSNTT